LVNSGNDSILAISIAASKRLHIPGKDGYCGYKKNRRPRVTLSRNCRNGKRAHGPQQVCEAVFHQNILQHVPNLFAFCLQVILIGFSWHRLPVAPVQRYQDHIPSSHHLFGFVGQQSMILFMPSDSRI
jgi:hypothetical protein